MKQTSMIEKFLDGKLEGKERSEFEKRIASDKKLASEVDLHKDVNDAIKEDYIHKFRMNIRRIIHSGKYNSTNLQTRMTRFIKYPIAAAIILLIGFSVWQLVLNKSSFEIYSMFYSPYQTDISTRSGEHNADKIQLSYLLYQEGDYEASFELLRNYLAKDITNQTAHFYYGMNALELQQYDVAITELETVAHDISTPFSLHANWYLAMAYLKIDQKEKASKYLKQLSNTNNFYTEKAARILRML